MGSHSNTILRLQKRAARTIVDAPWDAPSTALLSYLDILSFQERVAKLKAKMLFKVVAGQQTIFKWSAAQLHCLQVFKIQRSPC